MSTPRSFFANPAALAAMRIGGAGVGFLTQIYLARLLGAHNLGIFYSATSLAATAGFIMSLGYSQIAFRFAARYRDDAKQTMFGAFVSRATIDAFAAAAAAAILIVALSFAAPGIDPTARVAYAVAGGMVFTTTALTLYTNLAGAIRMFGWSYVPEGIGRPVAFLVGVFVLAMVAGPLTAIDVTVLFGAINACIAVLVIVVMLRVLPRLSWPPSSSRRVGWRWRREGLALVLLSLYTNSFSDIGILFATPFLASADVALFGVCLKLSLLIGYAIQIAQQMTVPDLADARRTGDVPGMQRAVRKSLPFPIALTLAAMLGCAVLGTQVLALFGEQFTGGYGVLLVLVACQVVRAMAGPSAHLITLNGAQKLNAALCLGALAVLLGANALLAPRFGAMGAAAAVFISYTMWLAATGVALARLGEIRTDLLTVFNRPSTAPAE